MGKEEDNKLCQSYFGSNFGFCTPFYYAIQILQDSYRRDPFGVELKRQNVCNNSIFISNYEILADILKNEKNYYTLEDAFKTFKKNISKFINSTASKDQLNTLSRKYFNCDHAKLINNISEMLNRKVPISNFCKTNNQLLVSNYSCLESKIGEDRSQMPHMIFKYFEDNLTLFQEVPTNANDSSGVVTSNIATSSTAANNMTTYNGSQRTPTNNGNFSQNNPFTQSSDSGRPSPEQKTLPIEGVEKVLREGLKDMEALLDKKLNMFSNNQTNSYQLEETKKKLAAEEDKTKRLTIEIDTLKRTMSKVEEESERKTQEIGRKNQEIEELKIQMELKLQSLFQQKENSQRLLDMGVISNSKTDKVVDKARRGLSEIQDKITNIVLDIACSNEMEDAKGILFESFYKISLCHAFYCEYKTVDNIIMTAYRKLKTLMDESKINLKQGWESILPDFKSVIDAMFNLINEIPDNLNIKLDFSNDPKNKIVQEISQGIGQSSLIDFYCLFPSLSHGESLIEKGSILKVVKFQ